MLWAGETADTTLVINEVQAANLDQYLDDANCYGGWIELYNPTSQAVQLKNMYLSDGVNEFRLLVSHGTVPAGGFKTLWFDHYYSQGNYGIASKRQIPFKLDSEGGIISLLSAERKVVASATYPEAVPRCSWVRTTDGGEEWLWTSEPTPGSSNTASSFSTVRLSAPVVDTDSRVFSDPFSIRVKIPSGTTLVYTTDGSAPTATNGETSLDGCFDIAETTILRFCLLGEGCLPSPVVTRSFIYQNHAYYLPVLSIVSEPKNFFDNKVGVFVRGTNGVSGNGQSSACNWNMDWERPVNMEYLVPVSSGDQSQQTFDGCTCYQSVLNQEMDLEICGGWTRAYGGGWGDDRYWEARSSFRLKTDKKYEGVKSIDYPVFPMKPYNKYRCWQVRNGGNDTSHRIKDAALQQMVLRSGFYVDCQDYQPAHVFLNGAYFGMFNIRESNNKHFAYSNYGIDFEDMDQFDLSNAKYNQKVGDNEAWLQLKALSRKLVQDKSEETYRQICDLLDIDEYVNYMALECYIGPSDWITNTNNVKGFRSRSDGKFHFVLFDLDSAFGVSDMLKQVLNTSGGADVDDLFRNLMKYDPFRRCFMDAFCIVDGSVLEQTRCEEIVREIYENTNTALTFEGSTSSQSLTGSIRSAHDGTRMNNMASYFQPSFGISVNISSNIPEARLAVNGQEFPTGKFAGRLYSYNGLPIQISANASAGYTFAGWQSEGQVVRGEQAFDLQETFPSDTTVTLKAIFLPISDEQERWAAGASPLRINEVSAAGDIYISDYGKRSDWVELYNTTDHDIPLGGLYLSDNRNRPQKFRMQDGVVPAHGYSIIWCDADEAVSQLHAPFKLSNADGAAVCIQAADGSWADCVEYLEQGRWQTYGRYPDGGNMAHILNQPSIAEPNSLGMSDFVALTDEDWLGTDRTITLDLAEGWNWTSHNLDVRVDRSRFQQNALSLQGEDESLTLSEAEGWQGTLQALREGKGYKIRMARDAAVTLRGPLYDLCWPVTLHSGWNWTGCPLANATTIEAALANYDAQEGDKVIGLDVFAVYEGGQWHGSLEVVQPGQAYLFYTLRPQDLWWNSLSAMRSRSKRYAAARQASALPLLGSGEWASLDIHAYPDVMTMVASVEADDEISLDGQYYVGAFCGDECRGIGVTIDGLLYMNIHGEEGEEQRITFCLLDAFGKVYASPGYVNFQTCRQLGSVGKPFPLWFVSQDNILGVEMPSVASRGKVKAVQYFNLSGQKITCPQPSSAARIVIRKETYEDGSTRVTKIYGPSSTSP